MNAEKKNFYGWILLVAIGIMFLCSSGFILVGASVVNPLMMADSSMNMNATLMGLGFTLFVLCQGIPAPLIGQFITKYAKVPFFGEKARGEFAAVKAKLDPKGILNPGKVAD